MIKVAEQTYKLANEKGLLTSYLIWCELKTLNTQGTIRRDSYSMDKAAEFINKSTSTLRRHLTKLIKHGLVRRHKYSYSLVSYDKCWELLGCNLTPNPKKDRKGNFAIFKINSIEKLKEEIEFCEIKIHQQRQAFSAREAILKSSEFSDTEKKDIRDCRPIDLPELLDSMYESRFTILKTVEDFFGNLSAEKYSELKGRRFKYIKITPYLTCYRTSIILGYEPNSRTGLLIRKRIERAGFAVWKRRVTEFLNTLSWGGAVVGEKVRRLSDRILDTGEGLSTNLISRMEIV